MVVVMWTCCTANPVDASLFLAVYIKIHWSLLHCYAFGWNVFQPEYMFCPSSIVIFHLLQACVKRVEGDDSGHKHCTGQYFDYWFCVDKCVSFPFHFLMLSWIIIGLVHIQNYDILEYAGCTKATL